MSVLKLEKVVAFYKPNVRALAGVSLTVEEGEVITVSGPPGCGKTAIYKAAAKVKPPDEGTVEVTKRVGFIKKRADFISAYSIRRNIELSLEIIGKKDRKRVREMLERFDIVEHSNLNYQLLTPFERQRAAVARALVANPELVVADEPGGELLEADAEQITNMILDYVKESGAALLYLSTNVELPLGRRIHMKDGKILEVTE